MLCFPDNSWSSAVPPFLGLTNCPLSCLSLANAPANFCLRWRFFPSGCHFLKWRLHVLPALSTSGSFFLFFLPIPQSFPFSEDLSMCFLFVLTPGPLVTVGLFNVHVNDLSSILASTQSTSTTCGRTPWTAPSSGLWTSLFPSSCFSCLPLPSSGSCQHMAVAASPFASSILTLSCLSPVMHDPFFISVAGDHQPCCLISSFTPSLGKTRSPVWVQCPPRFPTLLERVTQVWFNTQSQPGTGYRHCPPQCPCSASLAVPMAAPQYLPLTFRIKSKHPNLVFEALCDVIVTSSFTALTLFL